VYSVRVVSGADRFVQFQGCYLDSNTYDEFRTRTGVGSYYTPAQCMQECRARGNLYAGILRWNVSTQLLIHRHHRHYEHFKVAVNLSPSQFVPGQLVPDP